MRDSYTENSGIDDRLSPQIRYKLYRQLFKQSISSLNSLMILDIILYIYLHNTVPQTILLSWFVATTGINIFRLYLTHDTIKKENYDSEKRVLLFTVFALSSALLWGLSVPLFTPYMDDQLHRLALIVLILGIAGGAVNSLSSNLKLTISYLFILLLPIFFYFLSIGRITGYLLAVYTLLYFLVLSSLARNMGKSLKRAYLAQERAQRYNRELFTKKEELQAIFEQAPVGILYYDTDLKVIDVNRAVLNIFQITREELIGIDLKKLPDKRPVKFFLASLEMEPQHFKGEYISIKGMKLWIDAKGTPLIDEKGRVVGGVAMIENKTKEKKALDELNFLAHKDNLTGLSNRRELKNYMHRVVNDNMHKDSYSLLFYLDLNRFKHINDSLGHSVGDALLVHVANRLEKAFAERAFLSRLGGDEFVIVVPFVSEDIEGARRKALETGETIRNCFSFPFIINDMHLHINCSMGVVVVEPDMNDEDEIIRYADISMYQAKRKQECLLSFYNPEMDTIRKRLFNLQHDLNYAISREELELHYQPIVRASDGKIVSAEALIRWKHPRDGLLLPDRFLPIAIETGFIDEIGWWTLQKVCSEIERWRDAGLFHIEDISINMDAIQLQSIDFEEKFISILDRYGISPKLIRVELTETSLIDNFEHSRKMIEAIRERGIRWSIDDFGTGYSSLSYLRKLSFSTLKIDREFIKDIENSTTDLFLVKEIVNIGKHLGYKIVIEGIENLKQYEEIGLVDENIYYQGFYFSRPLPAESFEKLYLRGMKNS